MDFFLIHKSNFALYFNNTHEEHKLKVSQDTKENYNVDSSGKTC